MSRIDKVANDVYSRHSLIYAFKDWYRVSKLGRHPLSRLEIVQCRVRALSRPVKDQDFGLAIKGVINKALDLLPETSGKIIKRIYIDGTKMGNYVEEEGDFSLKTYTRRRNEALEQLSTMLLEWDNEAELAISKKIALSPFMAPRKDIPHLFGRTQLFNDIKDRLTWKRVPSVVLTGIPGVGKTALAVELANDLDIKNFFCDGILWAGLGKEPDIDYHLGQWSSELKIFPEEIGKLKSVEEHAERIKKEIDGRRLLLILDDVWQAEIAEILFSTRGQNCAFIVTTRDKNLPQQLRRSKAQTVSELDISDGIEFLSVLAPSVVEVEPNEAKELVEAVGGLPLALRIMGDYLAQESHAMQQRRIKDAFGKLKIAQERVDLAELPTEPKYFPSLPKGASISLNAVFSFSFEALDESIQNLLCALAIFPPKPNTFAEEAVTNIFSVTPQPLDKLIDLSLLEGAGKNRYTLHKALHDYVSTKMVVQEYSERFIDYFIDFVADKQHDYEILALDIRNIQKAIYMASDKGRWKQVIDGVLSLYDFMEIRGMYEVSEKLTDIAYQSAREINNKEAMARIDVIRGRRLNKVSEHRRAIEYFEQGLAFAEEVGDNESICKSLEGMGVSLAVLGEYDDAEQKWLRAIKIARIFKFERILCDIFRGLGSRSIIKTKYDDAEKYLTEGLMLSQKIGYPVRECSILSSLASLKSRQGQYDLAEQDLLGCLQIAKDIGYDAYLLHIYSQLVGVMLLKDDTDLAIKYIQKALPLANQIGTPEERARLYRNYGETIGKLGDYPQACQHFSEALSSARKIENQQLLGGILAEQGEIHFRFIKFDEAEKSFDELLIIGEKSGDKELIGTAKFGLARVAASRDDYLNARLLGNDALRIYHEIEDPREDEVEQFLDSLPD